MSGGEAVIFFDRSSSEEFAYRCKQAGQLASKLRFLSAQSAGMLKHYAWVAHAGHAKDMAKLLENNLRHLEGVNMLYPVQANAVFCSLPAHADAGLRRRGRDLYTFIGGGTRFLCSWDSSPVHIQQLVRDLHASIQESP